MTNELEDLRKRAWHASTVTTSGTEVAKMIVAAADYIEKLEARIAALEAAPRQSAAKGGE